MNKIHKLFFSIFTYAGFLAILGYLLFNTKTPLGPIRYVFFGLIVLMFGIHFYFEFSSYKNEKAGLNPEDELSVRIKERAAARAFHFSIYMWTFIIIFQIDKELKTEMLIFGITFTLLFYLFSWLYYSKVGISNENKN